MKLKTKHNIYEVWNEYVAESVYVDHKPTDEEIKEIFIESNWSGCYWNGSYKVKVSKLKPFYTK